MNKIIRVINAMISNYGKISNVVATPHNEYFFIYNNKHKWSMIRSGSDFTLFLYPDENIKLEELAFDTDFDRYNNFVSYRSEEYKSAEATETFSELFKVVKNKIFGVDDILDDILKD